MKFTEPQSLPHEDLLEKLSKIDISKINAALPLDTWEKPIFIYGEKHFQYAQFLETVSDTLKKGHTLTRKELSEQRLIINTAQFFISDDGYLTFNSEVFPRLLAAMTEITQTVQNLYATVGKNNTVKHNLRLTDLIVADMIDFVESLRIDHPHLSHHTERNRRFSARRDLENDPQ